MRTDCQRQLRLLLATDPERAAENMPGEQPPRPGLEHLAQLGIEWQHEKVTDLAAEFGASTLVAQASTSQQTGRTTYTSVDLTTALSGTAGTEPVVWIVEGTFPVGAAFERALNLGPLLGRYSTMDFAALRPDIVQVAQAGTFSRGVAPDGSLVRLAPADGRRQLRVIDIKLTAEPSAAYFAEVVLYSMTLAAWLVDVGLDGDFVVADEAALWPGSHDASSLRQAAEGVRSNGGIPTPQELLEALKGDLEVVPFEVFAPRVRAFFDRDLDAVLSRPWKDLEWHVDNHCKGCPFLGAEWKNSTGQNYDSARRHCWQMAEDLGHVSQVAYVSRGARTALGRAGVLDVATLGARGAGDPAFDEHYVLRATRTVVAERASVLSQQNAAVIAPDSGTSSVMPKWADLRIQISVDFDVSSAISFAFGVRAFAYEPTPFGAPKSASPWMKSWEQVFVVDTRDVATEQRELLAFLRYLHEMLEEVKAQFPDATVQFYIWDSLEQKHLARVVGRHLEAILRDPQVQDLAWLFPSEELLPNAAMEVRRSAITVVRNVIRSLVAAPVPHYYSLLEVARNFHRAQTPASVTRFSVHPMFEDPLSDQIPSERAHDIWSRSTNQNRYWRTQLTILEETVRKRLSALEEVRSRLEEELRPQLSQTAPRIAIGAMKKLGAVAVDSELWFAYSKLNAALDEAEVDQVRAMPVHEREARFRAARLERLLTGQDEIDALARLGIAPQSGLRVYQIANGSREVRARNGDIGFAIAPGNRPGILDAKLKHELSGTSLDGLNTGWQTRMSAVLKVTVEAIDRDSGIIAVKTDPYWPTRLGRPALIEDLETELGLNLTTDVVLDPVASDFFNAKLESTLKALGNPPSAATSPLIRRALGHAGRGPNRSAHVPAADFLWNAKATHETGVPRNTIAARAVLEAQGVSLNASQWTAWEEALTRRLQTIWGPPGTGKSRTLRAIALGAVAEAHLEGHPLRVLICASTYTAIDNVLVEVADKLDSVAPGADVQLHRIRSVFAGPADGLNPAADRALVRRDPTDEIHDLRARLNENVGITVVGSTPEQLHNLMTVNDDAAMVEWFDLILFDEASQTDVAHATLPLAAAATGAALVPAGDPKQLPPIHQAEAPLGLESMVGSFLSFLEEAHELMPVPLIQNYRSNDAIVEFGRQGGYPPTLRSFAPELRLRLDPPSTAQPPEWPASVVWSPEWDAVLDPETPAVAFIYDDEDWSSQWNQFEADAVAALLVTLRQRLNADLAGQLYPDGTPVPNSAPVHMSDERFWTEGVGVVTPHRAQQALVLARIQQAFPDVAPELLRGAVDTVERFQGQERDLIIVTYALGDPDAIRDEEEFLLGSNRFNVATSRARAKVIVLVSEQVVEHLSDEVATLWESRLLKLYTNSFTRDHRAMKLPFAGRNGDVREIEGQFRWRS